jgi:hypothetical protein
MLENIAFEFYNLYCRPNVSSIQVIQSRKIWQNMQHAWERLNVSTFLLESLNLRGSSGKKKSRWEVMIKMELKEILCGDVDST